MKRRIIFFVSSAVCVGLGLLGCAEYPRSSTSSAMYSFSSVNIFPTADDPDGDGDTKGRGYFPETRPATGRHVFIFDPNYTAWAAYDENGHLVNTGKASGGNYYCPDINRSCKTITGKFRIISKGDADCISSIYPLETNGGSPMPYCMYFSSLGYAVHGSYEVAENQNVSHGCIRITPTAAEWLSRNFMNVGTTVIVVPY